MHAMKKSPSLLLAALLALLPNFALPQTATIFAPADFKLGSGSGVWRGNLVLWNAIGTPTGSAYLPIDARRAFVAEIRARKRAPVNPELTLRYESLGGIIAEKFVVSSDTFRTYLSDTLQAFTGKFYFVFRIDDQRRTDSNIDISWVVLREIDLPSTPLKKSYSVKISWQPNSEPDLAGYNIYDGKASGNYTRKTPANLDTIMTLQGFFYDIQYFVAATAFDNSGNESDFSNEISFMRKDTVTVPPDTTLLKCDLNRDGKKDFLDYAFLRSKYGISKFISPQIPNPNYEERFDFNKDKKINVLDGQIYKRDCR